MAKQPNASNLGEELVRQDVITRDDLAKAQQRERESGIPWYRQMLQLKKIPFGIMEDVLRHEFHPKTVREEHQSLGRALVALKAISEEQLKDALAEQKRNGRLLGNILMDRGLITPHIKAMALSKQHGLEFAELHKTPSQREALDAVPESIARKNNIIPVRVEGDKITVLIINPETRPRLKEVSVLLAKRLYPVLTTCADIKKEITLRYHGVKEMAGPSSPVAKSVPLPKASAKPETSEKGKLKPKTKDTAEKNVMAKQTEAAPKVDKSRFEEIAREASGAPVMKLVSTIIEGAANSGATDIHLDPQDPEMRVRYRIDGVLHDVMSIPRDIEAAVVSRIKIMSDIDITETRHPQDGHIGIAVGDMEYDIRVATMPTYLGERIVLRLLDQSSVLAGIKDLGLEAEDYEKLARLIEQPYGMILVTGPTGSGKTTTLYAALNQKNVMTDSIVTLEDPVEYQLSGINQVQIDTDIDLTFANTLRAALRQDIDVLLVGEIRDAETARIAIRAAMTGHLVFSTMHTNDAPEAISTLRNMGIPSYLIASALTAVVGQRLVRKICQNCRAEFTPQKSLLNSIGISESTKKLFRGKGCDLCYHTGNKGRTGIFEVIEITPDIRKMITADETIDKISKTAKLKTMAERCRLKAKEGIVSPEEFLRVIRT